MQSFVRRFNYMDAQNLPYVLGIGVGEGHADYFWDGSQRKDQLVMFQYTLAGQGTLRIGGKEYPQKTGDFFLAEIPSKFTYYGTDWQFLYVEFSAITRQWLKTPSQIVTGASKSFEKELLRDFGELKEELNLYENAEHAFRLFLSIKEEVDRHQMQLSPAMEQVKAYIEAHYQEDLSLDVLASQFEQTKFQLIRSFEAAYHYTPMAYLRKYRILKSLELLWDFQTVDQVAKSVGIANGNYFAKIFKSEMGMSPSEYKAMRNSF